MSSNLVCYFDGACEPRNPGGNMGIGACARFMKEEIFRHSLFVPAHFDNSNNVAEYMAFEALLDWLLNQREDRNKYFVDVVPETEEDYALAAYESQNELNEFPRPEVHIFGDSMLVISQMLGQWKIKQGRYVSYAQRCQGKLAICRQYYTIFLGWIRRTENAYADELSKAELIKNNVEFKLQKL